MTETTYSIEASDGQRYGPVSLDKLREWAAEGRIQGATTIVVHPDERRVPARDVPGLFESPAPPPHVSAGALPAKKTPAWVFVLVALGGLGVCGCGCGVLGAILFPVFAQAKYAAKKTMGLSNMKQLALGAIMYSADADDRFPTKMESALSAKPYLAPYTKNEAIFLSANPKGGEILGDARLSGKNSTTVTAPDDAVMFYDGKPWPRGEAMVSYTDGHARSLPYREIVTAKAKDPFRKGKPTTP